MNEIRKGYIPDIRTTDDYPLGSGKVSAEILQPTRNWAEFLPDPEIQIRNFESYGCTGFATSSILEALLKRKFGGEWNFSERAIGVVAGTKPPGNTPKTVISTIQKKRCMLPEKDLPFDDTVKTVEEYYSPNPLGFILDRKAKQFLDEWEVGYEFVDNDKDIPEALKISPLGISVYAWIEENNVYYKPQGVRDTHWTTLYFSDGKHYVYDSYPPYYKILREDFTFEQVMRYSINKKIKRSYWWFNICQRLTV